MVDKGLLELRNHFHMQCIWFSFSDLLQIELNNFVERWNTHHIRSSKPNFLAGVPDQLFNFPEEYRYITYMNCETCLLLAELGYLKQQIDIERDKEIITFDLEDDTVMSYCVHIVQQLNLTYPLTNWTEAKHLFSVINEINESRLKFLFTKARKTLKKTNKIQKI